MKVTVFDYTNARDYLGEVLRQKQETNPRFSVRAWSRQLGFASPSGLSMILRGERKLQLATATRISESLRLKSEERRYFQILAVYGSTQDPAEKQLYSEVLSRLRPGQPFTELSVDKFRLVADWYHFVILEMSDLRDFSPDGEWIAARLGRKITAATAQGALSRLLRLGLLVREEGGRVRRPAGDPVSTTRDVPSDALKSFHTQMLDRAAEALRTQDVRDREISNTTMCIDSSKIALAKEAIRRFQAELAALIEGPGGDHVYTLNVQFFRMTEESAEEPAGSATNH
jgi:uncharacterized protein (TIGR02147 family)